MPGLLPPGIFYHPPQIRPIQTQTRTTHIQTRSIGTQTDSGPPIPLIFEIAGEAGEKREITIARQWLDEQSARLDTIHGKEVVERALKWLSKNQLKADGFGGTFSLINQTLGPCRYEGDLITMIKAYGNHGYVVAKLGEQYQEITAIPDDNGDSTCTINDWIDHDDPRDISCAHLPKNLLDYLRKLDTWVQGAPAAEKENHACITQKIESLLRLNDSAPKIVEEIKSQLQLNDGAPKLGSILENLEKAGTPPLPDAAH